MQLKMSRKQLTILVTVTQAVGPVNACAGALSGLLARGHRVIFAIDQTFTGKLTKLGYEEHLIQIPKTTESKNPGEALAKSLLDSKVLGDYTPQEKIEHFLNYCNSSGNYAEVEAYENGVKEAIQQLKPDLIYADCGVLWPSVYYSGIPWIRQASVTPIFYLVDDEVDFPPASSGFPSFPKDIEKWKQFNELRRKYFTSKKYNDFLESKSYDRYSGDVIVPWSSAILTVYGYPDELNYPEIRQKENWFNLEVFNKTPKEVVELEKLIPNKFLTDSLEGKWSGKLIYVSMGSMGSVDLRLMKRLVQVLGKTNHKYIVSKGPRHSEYDLPSNMYGDRYLPQTALIPHVDLVITHGGNNTVTETFAQGKPMIVFPLFSDQFDNAQRLDETGFGIRLDTYKFTDDQLVQSVDKILFDEQLYDKYQKASQRIQSMSKHAELALKIENLLV